MNTPFDHIKPIANKKPKKKIDSEKDVERIFSERCKRAGMWAIKFLPSIIGLPDRIVFVRGGRVFFTELKTTGKKPTLAQLNVHDKFRKLGFNVYVIDKIDDIDGVINTELKNAE